MDTKVVGPQTRPIRENIIEDPLIRIQGADSTVTEEYWRGSKLGKVKNLLLLIAITITFFRFQCLIIMIIFILNIYQYIIAVTAAATTVISFINVVKSVALGLYRCRYTRVENFTGHSDTHSLEHQSKEQKGRRSSCLKVQNKDLHKIADGLNGAVTAEWSIFSQS